MPSRTKKNVQFSWDDNCEPGSFLTVEPRAGASMVTPTLTPVRRDLPIKDVTVRLRYRRLSEVGLRCSVVETRLPDNDDQTHSPLQSRLS